MFHSISIPRLKSRATCHFEVIVMLLLKWQSRFLCNSTQTCNLKSEAVDNIRNGHYSRTQEKKPQMLFWVWGLVGGGGEGVHLLTLEAQRRPFIQPAEREGCEETLRRKELLLVSSDVLEFAGLCTASQLQHQRRRGWHLFKHLLKAAPCSSGRYFQSPKAGTCKSCYPSRDTDWGA